MHRATLSVATACLLALPLAACTSNTQSCSNGKCSIDLSGQGASVILGGEGGSEMELISASGKTAKVKLAGNEIELTVGQPINLNNATLVLAEVEGDDDIQVEVETTGAGEAPAAESEGNAPN